ncbi:hypothetical protein HQ520_05525 [bacterium]|nr:hypothetical protein [bacterium]
MCKNRQKNNLPFKKFVAIPSELFTSPVWYLLSHGERTVLIELWAEWSRQTRSQLADEFTAPFSQFSAATGTVSQALKKIEKYGVIERGPDSRGGLPMNANRFRLRLKWRTYKPDAKEQARLDRQHCIKTGRWKRNRQNLAKALAKPRRPQLQNLKNSTTVAEKIPETTGTIGSSLAEAGITGK